jgi:hypothetical protein
VRKVRLGPAPRAGTQGPFHHRAGQPFGTPGVVRESDEYVARDLADGSASEGLRPAKKFFFRTRWRGHGLGVAYGAVVVEPGYPTGGGPMIRALFVLALTACGGSTPPLRAAPLQVQVRLPAARHAIEVEASTFVWPSLAPPETGASPEACAWWRGEFEGRDFARRGLMDGSLRWGVIAVTRSDVSFGGLRVASLDERARPAKEDVDRVALQPLSETLAMARRIQDAWYEACGQVFRDRPLVVVDGDVPLDTLGYVLDTAAIHRFPRVALMTGDREPGPARPVEPDDPGYLVVVSQQGTQLRTFDSAGIRRRTGPLDQAETLLATALDGQKFGCTMFVPQATSRVDELTATLDTVTAFGSRTHLVHAVERFQDPGELPIREGRMPTEWVAFEQSLGVLWLELPATSPGTVENVRCDDIIGGAGGKEVPLSPGLLLALETVAPGTEIRANPLLSSRTLPVVEPGGSPIHIVARGPVDVGEPGARPAALQPALAAAEACILPTQGRSLPPSVAAVHVEFGPNGVPFDLFVETPFPEDPVSTCLRDAFTMIPSVAPLPEHTYAAVTFTVPFGGTP